MRKIYSVYNKDNELVACGKVEEILQDVPFNDHVIYNYADKEKLWNDEYRIVTDDSGEDKFKETKAYRDIVKCLEEYGNTNIIKKELKYLPKLKKLYRLDVKHYAKNDCYFKYAYGDSNDKEDWILTWLDWGITCTK